ncbi:hypothetical protein FDP41_008216 [Naegleria fowleri]|uniref:Uncharacterized protein n=1 Tax=Naegleria fowleri TaxID=5763 RepID=A0A6A5BFE1_NAEFO|nr:uncharacterized protein FDP41_008216 [Naegleria fowleri]KAF0973512.1 hypothetical protein FDP41_008216 [Naegleria fowleri]CAG4716259.1 unnamed protein product [Naegleria fowleri]
MPSSSSLYSNNNNTECIPFVLDAFEINYIPLLSSASNNSNSNNGCSCNGGSSSANSSPVSTTTNSQFTTTTATNNVFDKILLIDTPSGDDQSHYRREHFYKEGQVFVIMFALDRISSFEKVHDLYLEIKEAVIRNLTMILVGCKCDLTDKREITLFEGLELQRKIGAKVYLEISNLSGKNLSTLVDNCAKLGNKLMMQSLKTPSSQSENSNKALIHNSRPKDITNLNEVSQVKQEPTVQASLHHVPHNLNPEMVERSNPMNLESKHLSPPVIHTSTISSQHSHPTTSFGSKKENTNNQDCHLPLLKQPSGSPIVVEREFRFGIELHPKIYDEDDPDIMIFKRINFKIKKVLKLKLDVNFNPLCHLKKHIIERFGHDNPKIYSRKTEEQWLKSIKVQIFEKRLGDYYDLDEWEQVMYQQDEHIKLLVFF